MAEAVLNTFECHLVEWIAQVLGGCNPQATLAEEKIQNMHALAFLLYRNQCYQEASHFFRLLVVSRPDQAKYWKGLGACLQMLKDYQEAIDCYISAQTLNGDHLDPYLDVYMADCFFALKAKDSGLKALESARLYAQEKNDLRILKHVSLMSELWNKK